MFRISRRLDYGLQLMIALGATSENHPLPTAYLATNLNIPLPVVGKRADIPGVGA